MLKNIAGIARNLIAYIAESPLVAISSTTSTLGSSATFTGASFACDRYQKIEGTCLADEDGTLKVQFSNDGTNWDGEQSTGYTADDKLCFHVEVAGRLCRILFVNGATGQSTFRLYWNGRF